MKIKKLNLQDFEAVSTAELLQAKGGLASGAQPWKMEYDGGGGGGGGCKGDDNGFGGTFDMNEVVGTARGPRYSPSTRNASRTGSVAGQIVKRIAGIPSALLSTQGLNTSEPYSFSPHYVDPTSNCN